MNKILVTSIEHDFTNTSSKKILLEIPANNSLLVEIIKSEGDDNIETKIYAVLRDWGGFMIYGICKGFNTWSGKRWE